MKNKTYTESISQGKKTIVVKVGTSSLTEPDGRLSSLKVHSLAKQLACLYKQGHHVILVTSGAIAAGYPLLGYHERPTSVPAKQASAAVGQGLLMEEYSRYLSEEGIVAAQLLLTRDDFSDKRRYKNAFNALEVLLARGAMPIINENDTVSIEELRVGDNDKLSAQLAAMVHADLLILVTDTDGLYTADPRRDENARHIPIIDCITPEIEAMASGASTRNGTGGMATKIAAAKLATQAGVAVAICNGSDDDVIARVMTGSVKHTLIKPHGSMKTRLQWMAFYALTRGSVIIDAGAKMALCYQKRSLLPAGIRKVEGDFAAGDIIKVYDEDGICLGRGRVNFSADELIKIAGMATGEIEKLYPGRKPEAINRDDWVCELEPDDEYDDVMPTSVT
ncbi:MAG: glutamate 5-kinase [Eubacteriales bacterium]|jgi:glutamate 5-kinase|nr:glutamate 5-kinase [Clostridiales bacterium]